MYDVEQQYLEDIEYKLNSMPRKMFIFEITYDIKYKLIQIITVLIT
jgi:hypothetical protein